MRLIGKLTAPLNPDGTPCLDNVLLVPPATVHLDLPSEFLQQQVARLVNTGKPVLVQGTLDPDTDSYVRRFIVDALEEETH